ncbi:MAG TPA: hypothetical protein VJQ82_20975, partial [Terriglobales bacterium]|nr:hypothetical protein [Terriglobales bacterium]
KKKKNIAGIRRQHLNIRQEDFISSPWFDRSEVSRERGFLIANWMRCMGYSKGSHATSAFS